MEKPVAVLAAVCLLICPFLFSQSPSSASATPNELVERLKNSDPSVRGAAKLELMRTHPPEALPLLLAALGLASGEYQSQLLEVLSAFKDPRKIPALLKIARPYSSPDSRLELQFHELGAPAAEALMKSVPDECEGSETGPYASWVATVLGGMEPSALPVLLAGLRSHNPCRQRVSFEGLTRYFCCEEAQQFTTPDASLFLDAALNQNQEISGPVGSWIDSLSPNNIEKFQPLGVVEVLIKAYQGNVSARTRVDIAKMLAELPNPRITRFMRAAVHAPSPEVQKIARGYLAANAPAPQPASPVTREFPLNTSKEKIAAADKWGESNDPAGNTPELVKLLNDSDPDVRAAAARNLGILNSLRDMRNEIEPDWDNSVPPLIRALKDPADRVRLEAVKALGSIEYNREDEDVEAFANLFPELEKLLSDPRSEVVAATAQALGGIRAPGGAKLLVPLAANANDDIRLEAVKALSQFNAPETTCPLLAAIDDPNPEIRQAALEGVSSGFQHGERCPGDVDKLLDTLKDPIRRLSVVGPLSRLHDPRAVEPLIAALNTNTYCPVGDALAELGDKRAVKPLLGYLPDACVLKNLARLNDASAVPAIAAILKDQNPFFRTEATRTLIAMRQCQLMPEIRRGLSDESADVRGISAAAAAQCKDLDSVDLLLKMLPIDVRSASRALGALGDRRAVEPMIAVLRQAKPYERNAAAEGLGQLRDPRAVEPLVAAVHYAEANHEAQLGTSAVEALGKIANPEAIAALQEIVRNTTPTTPSFTPYADRATAILKKLGAPVPARAGKP